MLEQRHVCMGGAAPRASQQQLNCEASVTENDIMRSRTLHGRVGVEKIEAVHKEFANAGVQCCR